MNEFFWTLSLPVLIPLISGIVGFASEKSSRSIAFIGSLTTLALCLAYSCYAKTDTGIVVQSAWIEELGATYSLALSGSNYVLILLTALVVTMVIGFHNPSIEGKGKFYALLMLSMAGLMGVFLAHDLLLFYFFWELALIPVYFLASGWGGEKRVKVSFKFFIYTFIGSLVMLAGIIYLYLQSPERTFAYANILSAANNLSDASQQFLFWLFFIAFAIKMPVFPLHTWQPDAYEQTYTPVTIILSAVMVKMGIFAVMKWLLPLFPTGASSAQTFIMILCLISIVYGSLLAMVQTNIKRLIAYSSIAHIGLMALALFADTQAGKEATVLQMFNHGINIAGMWFVIWLLERKYGTQDIASMGRLAGIAPALSIVFTIISFANIGLPLTNGFVGEFLLFNGVFQSSHPYHIVFMAIAGLGIILGAVYTLNLLQKVLYIQKDVTIPAFRMNASEWIVFIVIIVLMIVLGVYPQAIMQFINL